MVEYVPETGLLTEIQNGDLLDENETLDQVEQPGPSGLVDPNIIWNYGTEQLFGEESIPDLGPGHAPVSYYPEQGSSLDENTVLYEEISRARCIDCDRIVDIGQPREYRKHSCELYKKLSCEKCGARFNLTQNLRVHAIIGHITQDEFISGTGCELCDNKNKKKFQRYSAFVAHLKTHMRSDNYTCSICAREFEYSCLYNRHRRIEHKVGEMSKSALSCSELGYCSKCDILMEQNKVDSHRLTHNAHLRLDKKARTRERAPLTRKRTQENRKHVCDICQKAFVRPSELKRHTAVHEKTPQWKCYICGKDFAHQSGLRSHKKTVHGEEKPKFHCPVCGLLFNKKSNCDRHVKDVHPLNSKKPMVECHSCACQFKNIGALNKHLLRVHKAEKVSPEEVLAEPLLPLADVLKPTTPPPDDAAFPHKCFKCDKRFKLRSSLKIHFDVHARKEIDDPVLTDPKCPICLKHLSSKNNLRRHLLTHQNNYECPDCCQKFHSIHRLDRHKCYRAVPAPSGGYQQDILVNPATIRTSTIPSKSYFCKQCPSSFFSFKGYKEHKALHSRLRPHLCWTCHKSFRTADLLGLHKEIHTREPVYCEFCPLILNGRAQYGAHVRAVHQTRPIALPSSSTLLPNRGAGISSSQSEYCADRGPMEGFRTRAQSADIEPREFDANTWIPMGNTETVADRSLRCPFCCHQFISVAHLTQHFANTQTERDHSFAVVQCPLCDMSMQGSVEAFQHFSSVHTYVFHDSQSVQMAVYGPTEVAETRYEPPRDTKKHQCSYCSSSFQKPSDLQRHLRIHTGERPFECDVCSRRFSLRSSLNAHIKIHSRGDPEFECSLCSHTFYNKNSLALHLRIHTGERPLKCRACASTFRTSSARRLHEQSVHNITPKNKVVFEGDENPEQEVFAPPSPDDLSSATVVDNGVVPPIQKQHNILFKDRDPDDVMMDTLAQISRVEATPLPLTKSSAFTKKIVQNEAQFIHITARRISIAEYTVTVARKAPVAIREGIDTTASIALGTLKNLAEQDTPMRLTLMTDNQQLSVMPKGVLEALGDAPQVVLRAYPFSPSTRLCVELLPPHHADFCARCDICDVDLPTKDISDRHFASEDHETAQVLHPLVDAVQDTIDDSLMIAPAISHHRREEVTCKLCGRKFLDTEPLVAHIRLEHERDHPHSLAPRPIARTAPPLEASRHQTTF